MHKKNIKQLLSADIDNIYLGNLKTVDCDILLPSGGANGSKFIWQSSHKHLISPDGTVNRPHFSTGDREVILTLTAALGDEQITKTYIANVLEKEYPTTVVSAYPITVYTKKGEVPHLPGVCVIRNNLEEDAVIPVKWNSYDLALTQQNGEFTVTGTLPNNVAATATVVVTEDENLLCPKLNISKAVKPCGVNAVRLLENSTFFDKQQLSLENLLNTDCDGMLYNFRVAAGLSTKNALPQTGWENPEGNLRGHTTGHFLSGLALAYGATGNANIKEKLDYMVAELEKCQQEMAKHPDKFADGFLSAYDESQFDRLEEYTTYPTIWAPYYTLHKIMAGLRDCYIYAHNETAFEMCKKIGMWVYNRLSKLSRSQRDKMWSLYIAGEFGGINEVLADLYLLTDEERYLTASTFFDNDKLYLPMEMNIDALGNLHANQHIPQIIGVLRQFEANGEQKRFDIADRFYNFVTADHTYSIGGVGETEMFKPPYQVAKFITEKTAESCASYNMLKLCGELYQYTPTAGYMHYYERTVTNHTNASGDMHPTGGSTYFMPSAPGSVKFFDYEENHCCHGTGLESHFKYGEYIYAQSDDSLYVNLFIPSELSTKFDKIRQTVEIDKDGIKVSLAIEKLTSENIKIRKPLWADNGEFYADGQAITPCESDGHYIFNNTFSNIDVKYYTNPYIIPCPDDKNTVSLCWGPYVLCAINDSKEFLTFGFDAAEKLIHNGNLNFTLDGQKFVPLNRIDDEPYHLYIKLI